MDGKGGRYRCSQVPHLSKPIVSDYGFRAMGRQAINLLGVSVYDVYQDASVDLDWTPILKETCDKAGISFFTSPYALELVDAVLCASL